MGKFFEALRKSETTKRQPLPRPLPNKVISISPETIEKPLLPQSAMDPRLVSFMEPDSPAVECFKMLRARIFIINPGFRPRTIMVTSAQPMEGKTTVAANLAISIAQGINEHVLLVDCDLRRPSMDTLLGLNAGEGIREYMENETSVASYLMKTPIKKLSLLPAGKPPSNPSELLSSEKMRRLVEELRGRYEDRYIIFDSAPAQYASEAAFLASMVDAVLLVVRSGKSAKDLILNAVEKIGRKKILGVVFNASNESAKDYNYYYRYYRKEQK